MATAAYREWVKRGRPWEVAPIVQSYRQALVAAGWPAVALGTIGDEDHLQAEKPQDHTPFSTTGWPGAHPYPLVLALDVMHNPAAGRDVSPLVAYWIGEARAGRTPWVKYLIWRATRYDVRNNWNGVDSSGHFDHAHVSFRTDYARHTVGSWQPHKKGPLMGSTATGRDAWAETIGSPSLGFSGPASEWLKYTLDTYRSVGTLRTDLAGIATAVQALVNRPTSAIDYEELARAMADSPVLISRLGQAIVERLTALATPEQIARVFGAALLRAGD